MTAHTAQRHEGWGVQQDYWVTILTNNSVTKSR